MIEAIKKRRSIRRYQDQDVEKEKVDEILYAAMCSPSAYHRNPWEFVVVKKEATREKLANATNYASFASKAPVLIVVTANEPDAYRWLEDASIVAGYIYLEATNQELGSCWIQIHGMETPDGKDSEEYTRSILKVPKDHRILCMMTLGYPAEDLPEHDKSKFDKGKVHSEKW